jgi:hypothetical protein
MRTDSSWPLLISAQSVVKPRPLSFRALATVTASGFVPCSSERERLAVGIMRAYLIVAHERARMQAMKHEHELWFQRVFNRSLVWAWLLRLSAAPQPSSAVQAFPTEPRTARRRTLPIERPRLIRRGSDRYFCCRLFRVSRTHAIARSP